MIIRSSPDTSTDFGARGFSARWTGTRSRSRLLGDLRFAILSAILIRGWNSPGFLPIVDPDREPIGGLCVVLTVLP